MTIRAIAGEAGCSLEALKRRRLTFAGPVRFPKLGRLVHRGSSGT